MRYLKHSNSQKHRTEVTRGFVLLVLRPWGRLPSRHLGLLGPRGLRWWPSPSLRCPPASVRPPRSRPLPNGGRTRSAPGSALPGRSGRCVASPAQPSRVRRRRRRGFTCAATSRHLAGQGLGSPAWCRWAASCAGWWLSQAWAAASSSDPEKADQEEEAGG